MIKYYYFFESAMDILFDEVEVIQIVTTSNIDNSRFYNWLIILSFDEEKV